MLVGHNPEGDSIMPKFQRRVFLQSGFAAIPAALAGSAAHAETPPPTPAAANYRLGMVTYNMGKDMTLDELFAFCEETGLEGVELRTTHKHGVEVELSAAERATVKERF